MTERVFISIGSNIDPEDNIKKAISLLAGKVKITGVSTVYRTSAEKRPGQPDFMNCVVEIRTGIPPLRLKYGVLRKIEEQLERERSEDKYAPRTIDLDLILYGDLVLDSAELTIPDPDIVERPFLAYPLCELAPDLTLPGSEWNVCSAAKRLADSEMLPLADFTDLVRRWAKHEQR